MHPYVVRHIWDILTLHGVEVIPHTLYSSDLVACDIFLFSTGKIDLKNRRFESQQAAPLGAAETTFIHLARNGFQPVFDE